MVAVVQPNLGFQEKRERRDQDAVVQELLQLTVRRRIAAGGAPRGLARGGAGRLLLRSSPVGGAGSRDTVRRTGIPVLAGGLDVQLYPNGSYDTTTRRSSSTRPASDSTWPSYRKTYLVPIIERVPFVNPRWFGNLKWFGGFGHGDRFPVYRFAEGRFGVLICYESAFEDLARRYRRDGADFLVNITNDAWFGRTAAPYQHAAHLVMRAIETRMGVARAANTGVSEFVDPLGYPHLRTPLDVERVEADTVYTTAGRTLYVELGDWVSVLALIGSGALLLAALVRRRGGE